MNEPASNETFNQTVADVLRNIAVILEEQGANHFRVMAYRRAANTVERSSRDIRDIDERSGVEGLQELPGVGPGIAAIIDEYIHTGRATRLDRLNGNQDPARLLQTVPNIGPGLAHAIHEHLHIDSLEGLEIAAHDGRLETVRGIGARRLAAIQDSLARILSRRRPGPSSLPDVGLVLEIDSEYRERAALGSLKLIAPRRFNPDAERWLPIMHAERDGWHFTVLFSNTARAHELGRTKDWVVVYFYDQAHHENQHTVVTERSGELRGKRVVRGRETECRDHYLEAADGRRPPAR